MRIYEQSFYLLLKILRFSLSAKGRTRSFVNDAVRPIRDIQEFQPNDGCNTESCRSTFELTNGGGEVRSEPQKLRFWGVRLSERLSGEWNKALTHFAQHVSLPHAKNPNPYKEAGSPLSRFGNTRLLPEALHL